MIFILIQEIFVGHDLVAAKEKALKEKVVWPWISPNEPGGTERKQILKEGGYKEWKEKDEKKNTWHLRNEINMQTTENPTDESTSTEATDNDSNSEEESAADEEEEDDV